MKDTYRHKGLRRRLVDEVRSKGIKDRYVLDAIGKVPRHLFLDMAFEEKAYLDIAFRIDCEQTISQPYTVARQTELLEIASGDKVMEIGTGSGYQAAVLEEMNAEVYSIERHKKLYDDTSKLLNKLGYNRIRTFHGDGMLGLEDFAPFDKIILTAAFDRVPPTLLKQLKIGGVLVMPLGDHRSHQRMLKVVKSEEGLKKSFHGDFRFVPLVSGQA